MRIALEEGLRIAALLFVWGALAVGFESGVSALGATGGLLESFGPQVGDVLVLTGLLTALLYLGYRVIDYWNATL